MVGIDSGEIPHSAEREPGRDTPSAQRPAARAGEQVLKSPGRGVVNLTLAKRDADIVDGPIPWHITISVDDQEPAAGPEHAMHLDDCPVLPGIMMETIGAGEKSKLPVANGSRSLSP